MNELYTDLQGRVLSKKEELNIIYEGSSFDGKMEISNLTSQLKSIEFLIREIVRELYKQKGFKEKEDVQIYLSLKKGSFQEIISIVLNSPIFQTAISGCLIALFTYYLNKKKKAPKCEIKIDKMINNYNIAKEIKQIVDPLILQGDTIKITSSKDSEINTEIVFEDKEILKQKLKKLKEQTIMEIIEEDFFGYLSMVNIDRDKYKFTLEGNNQFIPVKFDHEPKLEEIRIILGERLQIKARATYENKTIKSLDIVNYSKKRRKNLSDFPIKGS